MAFGDLGNDIDLTIGDITDFSVDYLLENYDLADLAGKIANKVAHLVWEMFQQIAQFLNEMWKIAQMCMRIANPGQQQLLVLLTQAMIQFAEAVLPQWPMEDEYLMGDKMQQAAYDAHPAIEGALGDTVSQMKDSVTHHNIKAMDILKQINALLFTDFDIFSSAAERGMGEFGDLPEGERAGRVGELETEELGVFEEGEAGVLEDLFYDPFWDAAALEDLGDLGLFLL